MSTQRIIHGDSFSLIKDIESDSMDTVFMDPPFKYMRGKHHTDTDGEKYRGAMREITKDAYRVVSMGGYLISVNYLEGNMEVWKTLENTDAELRDKIIVQRNTAHSKRGYLPQAFVTVFIFCKGPTPRPNAVPWYRQGIILDTGSITTNVWGTQDEKKWKAGYKEVNEAMPIRYADRLISMYATFGNVLDLFCGAGTVLKACQNHEVDATGFEIDGHRINLIRERLAK